MHNGVRIVEHCYGGAVVDRAHTPPARAPRAAGGAGLPRAHEARRPGHDDDRARLLLVVLLALVQPARPGCAVAAARAVHRAPRSPGRRNSSSTASRARSCRRSSARAPTTRRDHLGEDRVVRRYRQLSVDDLAAPQRCRHASSSCSSTSRAPSSKRSRARRSDRQRRTPIRLRVDAPPRDLERPAHAPAVRRASSRSRRAHHRPPQRDRIVQRRWADQLRPSIPADRDSERADLEELADEQHVAGSSSTTSTRHGTHVGLNIAARRRIRRSMVDLRQSHPGRVAHHSLRRPSVGLS